MRDIKFRAWDKKENDWFDEDGGDLYIELNGNINFGWNGEIMDDYTDRIILMQYTGLKDKNGVEIYEGGIVHWMTEFISPMDMRTKHKIDINVEVHQKESGEWVMGKVGNTLFEELLDVEVIGNIYENPELLED